MREIKSRAWCTHCSDMSSGLTLKTLIEKGHTDEHTPHEIWLQYTGLKDKNEKEIFEGDILESEDHILYEVKWYKDHACFKAHKVKASWNQIAQPGYWSQMVIKGDIYQNPELLK